MHSGVHGSGKVQLQICVAIVEFVGDFGEEKFEVMIDETVFREQERRCDNVGCKGMTGSR